MAIELDNSFTVPVPPEQAWKVLLDVERIAPCMPGASVDEVNGDEIAGRVKVKLGPVSLTYKGTAKFTERDDAGRSVSVEANGKETRGAGTASAVVQASLKPAEADGQTVVTMHTSLNVTGRPAQFGRGVMADVSAKLVEQFAANLANLLASGNGAEPGSPPAAAEAASPAPATEAAPEAASAAEATPAAEAASAAEAIPAAEAAPVTSQGTSAQASASATAVPVQHAVTPPQHEDSLNIVRLVAGPVLKRIIPVAAVVGAGALVYRRLRTLFRRQKS